MKRFFFGKGPRGVATFVCHVANNTDQRAKELLEHEFEHGQLSRRDRDLATELAYGTLRRRGTLDHVIATFSSCPLRRIQPRVLEILRLGAYQLLFLDKIPPSAAVNEAARVARRVSSKGAVGFVNACLRSIGRAIAAKSEEPGDDPRAALPLGDGGYCLFKQPLLPDPRRSPAEHLAAAHSHPAWLVRRWLRNYGEAATLRLCECGNATPPIVLRVNRLRTTRDGLLAELVRGGHWARPAGDAHVVLAHAGDLGQLPALRDGLCTVQGLGASRAAERLGPQAGELLVDVCSAPGSKACQLAELAENQARVVALDLSPRRLDRVRENVRRLGVRTVWAVAADGTACERLFGAPFDGALVDVPCSNTGVLARRVEMRWRLTEARLGTLAQLQWRLAASAARVVRPGGRLVYSTCSLEPEENDQIVERLCRERTDLELVEAATFLPPDTGDDGGYVAVLKRTSES